VLEVDDVGVVDVTDIVDGDPRTPIDVKAVSIMVKLIAKTRAEMLTKV